MKNMKVSLKLIVSFVIVLVLAVAVGVIGILGMNNINTADDMLYEKNVLAIAAMGRLNDAFQEQRTRLREYVINVGNTAEIQKIAASMVEWDKKMNDYAAAYEDTITNEAAEKEYRRAMELYQRDYQQIKADVKKAAEENNYQKAFDVVFSASASATVSDIVNGLEVAMENNSVWAKEAVDGNTSLFMEMMTLEIIILAVAAAVALFMAFYISSLISKPMTFLAKLMTHLGNTGDFSIDSESEKQINDLKLRRDESGQISKAYHDVIDMMQKKLTTLEAVSNGDLTMEVAINSPQDSYGNAMKAMVDRLNDMFGNIHASTGQVSSGAKQAQRFWKSAFASPRNFLTISCKSLRSVLRAEPRRGNSTASNCCFK